MMSRQAEVYPTGAERAVFLFDKAGKVETFASSKGRASFTARLLSMKNCTCLQSEKSVK
jgi:hypothetical protein